MSAFKKKLTQIFLSDIEKLLVNLIGGTNDIFLNDESFDELAKYLEGKNVKHDKKEVFNTFIKLAAKETSWQGCLKSLMILHKLILIIGEDFCHLYNAKPTLLCSHFKAMNNNEKNSLHSRMIPFYDSYLQKLSYNYEDLKVCFYPNGQLHEYISQNNMTMLHFLSKIQNMLNYLLNSAQLFESSFQEFPNMKIVKQLAYFCLKDCAFYYKFINGLLLQMIPTIFQLSTEDSIFLYELYSEHLKMTKRVEKLFDLRISFPEFELKTPDYFHISTDESRDIVLHVNKEKQNIASGIDSKKLKKTVSAPTEEPSDKEQPKFEFRVLKSVEDISKSLLQITTPNFKEVQKRELFKAPSKDFATASTTIGSSQISEDEKENNSNKFNGSTTNGNLNTIKENTENTNQTVTN